MYGFIHGYIGRVGPNVVSNPNETGPSGLLFRITGTTGVQDLIPFLEENFPGRITFGPDPIYEATGYTDDSFSPPIDNIGGPIVISDVDPGISTVSMSQITVVHLRDIRVDGVDQGTLVQMVYAMNVLRAVAGTIVKINRVEVVDGYAFDYSADPISPGSDGSVTGNISSSDFITTYIPSPSFEVRVYGEVVEDTSPPEPVDAIPGPIFPGFGLTTDHGNYIKQGTSLAWGPKIHPTQLQTAFSAMHEAHGIFSDSLIGMFLLTTGGSLTFSDDLTSQNPTVIATNCKSFCPCYETMRMSEDLLDVDSMAAILIVKNDEKVSWWSRDLDPHVSGIDAIPASLVAGSQPIQCVRYSGYSQIGAVSELAADGALFGALTTAHDLYLWGRQATALGFSSSAINVPGAIDFAIIGGTTPHILLLTDVGYLQKLLPDGSITMMGGGVIQMHKPVYEQVTPRFLMSDGKVKQGETADTGVVVIDDNNTGFLSEMVVTKDGKMRRYYESSGDWIVDERYAEVKAPPYLTIMYPGRTVYNETASPVPAKYRKCGGLGAGSTMGYVDTYGRVRRVLFESLSSSAVYMDSPATEGAVDFGKYNDRDSAVLDVYGDVYRNGGYMGQVWDKVQVFPGVKMKGLFSFRTSYPGNYCLGLGLDDKFVVPSDAAYSLPAHQVGKVMRFVSRRDALTGGYAAITSDGELYYSSWNLSGTPEYTGLAAIEFHPVQMVILDPATQLPVSQTDGGRQTSIIRNPDGTLSELPRATGGVTTNVLAGLDVADVRKIDTVLERVVGIQLASDAKKLRIRTYGFHSGVGGVDTVGLTKWFDITLPSVPVDWWVVEQQVVSSTTFFFTIAYVLSNGSLWYYKVSWADITNAASYTVDNQMLIPAGEVRTDIKTVGAPPVTGGWGLNWGNNFGG